MANKTLQLSLIAKWFNLTKSLIKTEDYREITPYFCNKFLLFNGKSMPKSWWRDNYFMNDGIESPIEEVVENIKLFCTFKHFDYNIMTLGYPKSTDTDKIVKFKHHGLEIRGGNPEWGAVEGKVYFCIKHGSEIL